MMKKFTPSKILIFSILAFLSGIFVATFIIFDWKIILVAIAILILFYLIFRRNKEIIIFASLGIIFLFGIFYYYQIGNLRQDELIKYYGKKLILQGQVVSESEAKKDKVKFFVQVYVSNFPKDKNFQKTEGKILIYTRKYPEFEFTDWVEFEGLIREPLSSADFDYKNYLAKFGAHSEISYPTLQEIEKPSNIHQNIFTRFWLGFKKYLIIIKNNILDKINLLLPEPTVAFLAGLLLGAKKSIPENLMSAFNRTGTTHIVVISGYNITIIISAFMALTKRWSKKLAITLAIIGIFLFTIMVGAEAPVLRAALMAFLLIWASRIGRKADVAIALLVTSLIMVMINPKILRFDLGFQLSFLAVTGLIWFSPILEDLVSKWRYQKFLPKIIAEPLVATISAQIFTVPLILFNFHRISLIAPLANILILPLVPMAMFLGFIAIILAFIQIWLGKIVAFAAWLLLIYMIWVVEFLSKFRWASLEKITISWPILLIWYLAVFLFIRWYGTRFLKTNRV